MGLQYYFPLNIFNQNINNNGQGGPHFQSTFEICHSSSFAWQYATKSTFGPNFLAHSEDLLWWCQHFMMSMPRAVYAFLSPGTRKSILHPQAVRGEEKHWSLILPWSTSFSALWFLSWPELKWAGNTNEYLGYPFCLCHHSIFFPPNIL